MLLVISSFFANSGCPAV